MGVFSRFRRKKQSTEEPGEPALAAELTDSGSDSGSGSEAGGTVTRVAVPGVTTPEEASKATEAAAEVVEIPRQQSADTAADAGTDVGPGTVPDAVPDADSETGKAART
ncbi:hypothetical protein [Streptomyces sp. NPDC047974]|uniref:hypothetical protein n=1 Tax=Streptomyces sp. NPDC047974 TaxID=3154343 RepID=UPI003400FD18